MSGKVWKALGFIGTIGILSCSCSKSISEPVSQTRLPAEQTVITDEPKYTSLEKVTLRNGKRVARPFFFKDGINEKDAVHYNSGGLYANLQLFENSGISMKQFLFDEIRMLEEKVSDYDPRIVSIKDGDDSCITELTYTKEKLIEEEENTLIYQYPCIIIAAVFRQADGSYLLLKVSVDNEFSTGETGKLYRELMSAYGIMYENK